MINVYLVYVRLNNEIFNLHEIKTTDISKNIKLYKFRMFIVIQLYYEILQTTSRYIIHSKYIGGCQSAIDANKIKILRFYMMTMQNDSYRSGLMVAERRGFDLCVSFSCYDYISITINCINYEQRCVFSIKDYVWVMPYLFAYRNRIIYPEDAQALVILD